MFDKDIQTNCDLFYNELNAEFTNTNNLIINDIGLTNYGSMVNDGSSVSGNYTVFVDYILQAGKLTQLRCQSANNGILNFVLAKKTGVTFQIYKKITCNVLIGLNTINIIEDINVISDSYLGKLGDSTALVLQGALSGHNGYYYAGVITDSTTLTTGVNRNYCIAATVNVLALQSRCDSLQKSINLTTIALTTTNLSLSNLLTGSATTYCNLNKSGVTASTAYSYIQNIVMSAANLDKLELYCSVAGSKTFFLATKIDSTHFHIYKTFTKTLFKEFNIIDLRGITITDGTYFGILNTGAELYKIDNEAGQSYYYYNGAITDSTAVSTANSKLAYKIYTLNDLNKESFYNKYIKRDGLLAYFRFDSDVIKSYDGNYTGTINGSVITKSKKLTVCDSDYSCYFDGNSTINFGVVEQFNFSTNRVVTVECLLNPNISDTSTIIGNLNTTGWSVYLEKAGKKNILCAIIKDSNGGYILAKSTDYVPNNTISHIAVTFFPVGMVNTGNLGLPFIVLKINGVEQILSADSVNLKTALTGNLTAGVTNLVIGAGYKGFIDELIVRYGMPNDSDFQTRLNLALYTNKPKRPDYEYSTSKNNVILDLDIDGDSDDLGDVHISKVLHENGEINLLGVVTSTKQIASAPAVKAIFDWWNDTTTPIYAYQGSLGVEFGSNSVALAVRNQFRPTDTRTNYTDDLVGYRTMLAAADDYSVTIITTGFLISVKRLMDSPADGISSLTGMELINKKVKCLMIVGNMFPKTTVGFHEYNALGNISSWKYVIENFPINIIFSGAEIGVFINSKPTIHVPDDYLTNPVRFGYKYHRGDATNYTWGQLLLILAARGYGENRFSLSLPFVEKIDVSTTDNLPAKYTATGNRWYLRLGESFFDRTNLQNEMNSLFAIEP